MGLSINRLSKGDDNMGKATIASVRVYRTTDGLFVGEGDPRGAFLAYGIGAEVAAGDVERYTRFTRNEPQDTLADASSKAYTDDATRDKLRRRQAGDVSERPAPNQTPALVHDRLATELADEAQALASMSPEDIAALMNEQDGDAVYATHAVWRTADGDLVHEGDENGATLAYPVGARIDDADVDEYNDLGDPPKTDEMPEAKAAATPRNKARTRTADK